MTTEERYPSRRAVIGAIGAAGAIAGAPIAAVARIEERAANRRPWDLAVMKLERARAEHVAADEAFGRAHAAWEPGQPSTDVIHWDEFRYADKNRVARYIDVETEWSLFLAAEGKLWWAANPDSAKARYRAALDSVLEYRRLEREHDERHGYSDAAERRDAAEDALNEAERLLLEIPAPDPEALLLKLELLMEEEREPLDSEAVAPVLADARRLLSRGRA